MRAGPEAEFFLFQKRDGEPTTETHDSGGYFDLTPVATTLSAQAPYLSRAANDMRLRPAAPFDLLGDLPVPRRYLKRAWRYVRRMRRAGPALELDVEATAGRRYRDGVLTAPVLVPRRSRCVSATTLRISFGIRRAAPGMTSRRSTRCPIAPDQPGI